MHVPLAGDRDGSCLAAHLGGFAAGVRWADAPPHVQRRALALIADVLATTASALRRPDVVALRDALAVGDGPSSVIGRAEGQAPALAGFLNAVPIAREQLQDGHRRARGHPGSHVIPAVIAVAEASGSSGPATLSAILAGYETGVRIGLAMDGTPPGVHDIATWGMLGAAAGVAHLLSGGDAATIAAAIDAAAALPVIPDATTVFAGFTGQNLYLATGVQAAILHGQAAAAGLRAAPGTLERHFAANLAADPQGFAERLGRLLAVPDAHGEGWTILDGYLKRHPTCALLHGVNDAIEDLTAQGPVGDPDDIHSVLVRTYGAAAAFDDPAPTNEIAARFSIPWAVAAGLAQGALDESAFSPEAMANTRLRALAERVRVEHDPQLDAGYPSGRPAIVTITLSDGTSVEGARRGVPRGDGATALEDPLVSSKPMTLLTHAAGQQDAAAVLAAIDAIEQRGVVPLGLALRKVGQAASVAAQFR